MRTNVRRIRRGVVPALSCSSVLGIDPSLTSTGFSHRNEGAARTQTIKTNSKRGPDRLYYLRSALRRLLKESKPQLVVYEGYAMGARGNNMFNIGELGGALLLELWEQGIDVLVVPPTVLKKAVTDSGNADKDRMKQGVLDLFGLNIQSDDEADAYALMAFGEAFLEGVGPAAFVKRVVKLTSKVELVHGRRLVDCSRLQK